jgi:pyrroline-5-carboxylate reductase
MLACLGGGNMAKAIIGGLLALNFTQQDCIYVSDPYKPSLDSLKALFPGVCELSSLLSPVCFS